MLPSAPVNDFLALAKALSLCGQEGMMELLVKAGEQLQDAEQKYAEASVRTQAAKDLQESCEARAREIDDKAAELAIIAEQQRVNGEAVASEVKHLRVLQRDFQLATSAKENEMAKATKELEAREAAIVAREERATMMMAGAQEIKESYEAKTAAMAAALAANKHGGTVSNNDAIS